MAQLSGSTEPILIDREVALRTPGFRGSAVSVAGRSLDAAAPREEEPLAALDEALARTDLREERTIVVRGEQGPVAPRDRVRTIGGEPAMLLELPDPGPDVGMVVMAIDERGAISWSHPTDVRGDPAVPRSRSIGATVTFRIRATTPPPSDQPGERSLVGNLGKKVLKVLTFPISGTVLETAARFFARKWEEHNRPYAIRRFGHGDYRDRGGTPVTDADWGRLGAGRALLFVHGTFSTAFSAFHALPPATMQALDTRYEGRMFAFDHFSLSHDPERNLVELLDRVPDSVQLDLDVISHSRGGLVARAISGEAGSGTVPGVTVGRSVLVAVPNHGTDLADPVHMAAFIDRHTSMLNLVPPGPQSVVVEILESIITAVKSIGTSALSGLPGLTSMDPRGEFLSGMNRGAATDAEYYAMASDYEPEGGLKDLVADGVIDRVFRDAANDLVVPTTGVFAGSADPNFPIPGDRLVQFGPGDAVAHNRFFSQPSTSEALLEWLQ